MKPAINQAAARTTTGTQNWTDASITSDFIADLFINSAATANDTITAAGKISVGLADGTRDYTTALALQDANAAPSCKMRSNANSILNISSGGAVTWAAARSATLANGITENYSAAAASPPLIGSMSFAGTDFEVQASLFLFTSTDVFITANHNCSGAPTAFMLQILLGETSLNGGAAANESWGFYDTLDGNSASLAFRQSDGTAPTVLSALATTDVGHHITAVADFATFSISGINSTQLTINRTAAGATSCTCILYSFRAKSGFSLISKVGLGTLPTGTGAFTPVAAGGGAQQVLFTVATRLTTSGTIQTDDTTGSISFGMACNNAGSVQQTTIASTGKDNVNPSVAKSQSSINKAIQVLDNTGALQFAATVTAFNSDGSISMNCSQNTGGIAAKFIYLSFGVISTPAAYVPRRTIRPFYQIYYPQSF